MLFVQEWSDLSNYVKRIDEFCSQDMQIFLKLWRSGKAQLWGTDANRGLKMLVAFRLGSLALWTCLGCH